MNHQEIWEKALNNPIVLTVESPAKATALRAQLYRYRERIKRDNKRNHGLAISEFDNLVISTKNLPDGKAEVRISGNSIDILEVREL